MSEVLWVGYPQQWPAQFTAASAAAAAEWRSAMGPCVADIQHIGSMAVPDLCARPVIDVAVGVHGLTALTAHVAALAQRGCRYRPEMRAGGV